MEGSLVKFVEAGGLPVYHDYSAIEDGKLFKISLKDLFKDSDKDGYNDIFEKSFGLNKNNKDTDGDGADDFNDLNPMFKSEKNKFVQLYEMLLPQYSELEILRTYIIHSRFSAVIVIISIRSILLSECCFYLKIKRNKAIIQE